MLGRLLLLPHGCQATRKQPPPWFMAWKIETVLYDRICCNVPQFGLDLLLISPGCGGRYWRPTCPGSRQPVSMPRVADLPHSWKRFIPCPSSRPLPSANLGLR
jgi:hypothetical protein